MMLKDESRIFKFMLPDELDMNSTVYIKASAYRGSAHDFTLSAAPGDSTHLPSTDFYSKKGSPAWKKGQVVRLNKRNFEGFIAGADIKVLLDVIDSGIYHIMVMTEDAEPLL
jgi:hypothetical protein